MNKGNIYILTNPFFTAKISLVIRCREEGGKADALRQERAPLAGRRFADGRALPFGARRVICSPARGARYSRGPTGPLRAGESRNAGGTAEQSSVPTADKTASGVFISRKKQFPNMKG